MTRLSLAALALACSVISMSATAQQREIEFVAVTTNGAPVAGQVMKRSGSEAPSPFVQLDARGKKKVTDVRCASGLQFSVKSKFPVFVGSDTWKDCEYGEIRFVFNEVAWGQKYIGAIEAINDLALHSKPGETQITAMFAASAFDSKDYGKLAYGVAQLRKKLPTDKANSIGLDIVEKDSLARALGVHNGIDVKPSGQVVFSESAVKQFDFLKSNNKLPNANIDTMDVKAFVAKKDLLNQKNLMK